MLTATVDEAALHFQVTPKTILSWVTQGMPTAKRGSSGRGNRTLIDMARAPAWKRQQDGARASITECFVDNGMPPNPLRWVAERAFDMASHAAGAAAFSWFADPKTDGALAWKRLGLTEAQARALVFEWWCGTALFMYTLRDKSFESKWIEPETQGANLDDMASLFLEGDVRSKWSVDAFGTPKCIQSFDPRNKGRDGAHPDKPAAAVDADRN